MNKWLRIIQQLAASCLQLPCHCLLCLRPSQRDIALCTGCEDKLPWLKSPCHRCSLPLAQGQQICYQCLQHPPSYTRLQALFDYAWPLNTFIGQFKYKGHLHFAKMLGKIMAERLIFTYPIDCIVPMPLHPARQRERGFNQTLELANIIAKHWQLPLDRWSCTKKRNTLAQSLLSARARASNVTARAFAITPLFSAKHVLVIEDVVTTGATVNALARALTDAGVATVEIWSCCRTIL